MCSILLGHRNFDFHEPTPEYEWFYKHFLLQSLKSRGIRFPGRNNESSAPIITPSHSPSAPEIDHSLAHLIQHDTQPDRSLAHLIKRENLVPSLKPEQTKEAFDVARNSTELLSSVLSSSPQQDVLKVFYVAFLVLH